MAIIYTYPNLPLSSLSAEDLLVITNVDPTNNNPTALRRHKGHRRDHFLGVSCAEKITRLWRKTAAPQAGKFWDRAEMRSTAEKEAHARASVRPHASSGETDSVRAADGLHAARPRSVRCWRYSARGLLALALYVRCPERVQKLRTATAALRRL